MCPIVRFSGHVMVLSVLLPCLKNRQSGPLSGWVVSKRIFTRRKYLVMGRRVGGGRGGRVALAVCVVALLSVW